jgi:hypothetical protein
MSSVPDGRAANHPFSAITFDPPMGAPLPGSVRENSLDFIARPFGEPHLPG